MTEYCNVAFLINPDSSCEDMFTALRNLGDYCDVYIRYDDITVDYGLDGIAIIAVVGEMPDTKSHWDRLVETVKDLDEIQIDYGTMREWI